LSLEVSIDVRVNILISSYSDTTLEIMKRYHIVRKMQYRSRPTFCSVNFTIALDHYFCLCSCSWSQWSRNWNESLARSQTIFDTSDHG